MTEKTYRKGLTKNIFAYLEQNGETTSDVLAEVMQTPKSNVVAVLTYMKNRLGLVTHPKRGLWCAVEGAKFPKRGRGVKPGSTTIRMDVLNLLERQPNLSLGQIAEALPGRRTQSVATIVSSLKREGLVEADGTSRTYVYRLVAGANKATVAA